MAESNDTSVWTEACKQLAEALPVDVYDRWIRVIDVVQVEGDSILLNVANDFYQSWLEENYLPLIRKALTTVTGKELGIEFRVDPSKNATAPAPAPRAIEKPKAPAPRAKSTPKLNPNYTFENFVVGSSNSFAHAAAMAVAHSPGFAYNPLFMYGGTGLGKTHLMQAIGHHVSAKNKHSLCYTRCEDFLNDYIEALQNKGITSFRKKYRGIDVLLIDDIHFLAGKERLQEEFFNTFNSLHENHKQIVMTSDRPAGELSGLEARLVSRFVGGQVTELEIPDVETRIAILQSKQKKLELSMPDDVIQFMADHIRSDIRNLEGALIRVASYASLHRKPATLDMVEYLLRDTLAQEQHEAVTIEMIQRIVAEYYDIRMGDMTSKQRPQSIAFPRQVAMYLSRSLTRNSLPGIGNAFGRNHATVMHACKLVNERLKEDGAFRQAVSVLKQRLGSS